MSAGLHGCVPRMAASSSGDACQGGVLLRGGGRVRAGEHRRGAVGRLAGAGWRDGAIRVAGAERRSEGRVDGVGADLAEFGDRGVDVVVAGRDQLVPARVGVHVELAGGDDDAEPGRGEPGVDPAGDLPPGDLPVPVEPAGADRDADSAGREVQVLGRAGIRQAVASPASASVLGRCLPRGEEAGQLVAGHVVQRDRQVAVRGRCLRWFRVIVVRRRGVRGTGRGRGIAGGCCGCAGRRGGLVFFWAGALVRTDPRPDGAPGRERRVQRLGRAGAGGEVTGRGLLAGWLSLRGGCVATARPAPSGTPRPDDAGRGGRDAVARAAVLRAVLLAGRRTGSAGRGSCRGRRGGRGPARAGVGGGAASIAAHAASTASVRRWVACWSSSSLGAVRPACGWTAAVKMRPKTALLASSAASSRSRRLLVMPGCIQAGISSHLMRAGARSSPRRSVISPSADAPYQCSPEASWLSRDRAAGLAADPGAHRGGIVQGADQVRQHVAGPSPDRGPDLGWGGRLRLADHRPQLGEPSQGGVLCLAGRAVRAGDRDRRVPGGIIRTGGRDGRRRAAAAQSRVHDHRDGVVADLGEFGGGGVGVAGARRDELAAVGRGRTC